MLATSPSCLQGTPYIYQARSRHDQRRIRVPLRDYRDIEALNMYHELVRRKGSTRRPSWRRSMRRAAITLARPCSGMTGCTPASQAAPAWIKVNPNYRRSTSSRPPPIPTPSSGTITD